VIFDVLDRIPEIEKNAKKEDIKTRPAAVTRANKQTKEKLPLIWKLEKDGFEKTGNESENPPDDQ